MRDFFYILFGGLIILFTCVGVFSLGTFTWRTFSHSGSHLSIDRADANTVETDGIIINQSSRYSADEEENLIDSAASILPSGIVKKVTAKSYSVRDLTTDQVLAEQNSNQLLPIASLTKLITAVIARRFIPDNAHINITKKVMSTYGNTADFKAGETFSAGDLLYPLLLVSSNDAAEAYAEYYGRAKFIQAMNDFTQSIGAYRTYFADPSGLDPKNVSTVNDLEIIIDWIRKNDPGIIAVTELKTKTVRTHTWVNPTHFLSWSYYVGGKNGYLPEANRTTVSLFQLGANKDVYAIVLLGSNNRDNDMVSLLKKIGN